MRNKFGVQCRCSSERQYAQYELKKIYRKEIIVNLCFGSNCLKNTVLLPDPPLTPTFRVGNVDVSFPDPVKVIRDTGLSVECRTTSNPLPRNYTWQLPDGSERAVQTLNLTNVQSTENNLYSCTAENQMSPSVGSNVIAHVSSNFTVELLCKYQKIKVYYTNSVSVLMGNSNISKIATVCFITWAIWTRFKLT